MHVSELTLDDLRSSRWKEIISRADRKDCSPYSSLFLAEAREAEKKGDQRTYQAYRFWGDVTSPMLRSDNAEEPFGPVLVLGDKRSAIPDDFSEEQLTLLQDFLPEVDDFELRARIADIIWIHKRDHKAAELAIESYIESAKILEDPQLWPPAFDRIERAFRLAVLLGDKAGNLENVVTYIEKVLEKYDGNDPSYLSDKLMGLLYERKMGDPAKYGQIAERNARKAEEAHDWPRAQVYWRRKADWDRISENADARKQSLVNEAETYVKLAQMSTSSMVASSHLSKAIEAYRRIGGMNDRTNELHQLLLEYEKKSLDEFSVISSPSVDISDAIKEAREAVKGKNFLDALYYMCTNFRIERFTELRKKVEESAKKHPISYLLNAVVVNDSGKVVGKKPGLLLSDKAEYEKALRPHMFHEAILGYSIDAQALISPMRVQIVLDHYVRVDDFRQIVSNNPLIPEGREYIYAKGLHAGLADDFLTATHLLVPQFENSLRYLLDQHGIVTSKIDEDGIQEEVDMNTLLYHPKIREIFGEDLIFHLQCLLVESEGANIRNKMAHGLMHHHEFYSPEAVYLWALILRLICWPGIIQTSKEDKKNASADDETKSEGGSQGTD